jgi:hypothetical protein
MWEKLRSQYLALQEEERDYEISLRVRYGDNIKWTSKTEQKKLESLRAKSDKVGKKMFTLIEKVSPRDWSSGVPSHWILKSLDWENVIRPLNEPLSVVPPLSYGATHHMR